MSKLDLFEDAIPMLQINLSLTKAQLQEMITILDVNCLSSVLTSSQVQIIGIVLEQLQGQLTKFDYIKEKDDRKILQRKLKHKNKTRKHK